MRSRTPPDLKWLLVERATLAGDLLQMELRQVELTAEIAKTKFRVQALDTTIRLCHSNARSDAAGAVRRHTSGYGRRGALKACIVNALQQAEAGITMRAVALVAANHFQLQFDSTDEFTRFAHNSVRQQLKKLREDGFAESLPGPWPDGLLWRWKRTLPTLADLARLASVPT